MLLLLIKIIVYRIWCEEEPDSWYIGSTQRTLKQRMYSHKTSFKRGDGVGWLPLADKYGFDSLKIAPLETYEITVDPEFPKAHAYAKELLWVNKLKSRVNVLNIIHPSKIAAIPEMYYNRLTTGEVRTMKQFKHHQWAQKNKERGLERNKDWRERNREKYDTYHLKYRETNREKLAKTERERYHENKEAILAYQSEIVKCECGASMRRGSLHTHRKTLSHKTRVDRGGSDLTDEEKAAAKKASRKKAKANYNAKNRNVVIECECGEMVKKLCLTSHRKSKKHARQLKAKNEQPKLIFSK
jgi:hypothetical protein